MSDLFTRAQQWIDADPDPSTRSTLQHVLKKAQKNAHHLDELRFHMEPPLTFGTAGLRGTMGPGPAQMNRLTVRLTTFAICTVALEKVPDAKSRGICVGFDGRHLSSTFATDVEEIAQQLGFNIHRFPEPVPTPLLAFACRELNTALGAMITASHNPRQYNGYKVYADNGAQIVPPWDTAIEQLFSTLAPLTVQLPMANPRANPRANPSTRTNATTPTVTDVPPSLVDTYMDHASKWMHHPEEHETLSVAYSAMHGVGQPYVKALFQRLGFQPLHVVHGQATPDPDFPSVRSPNPESPDSLTELLAVATREQADIALANDPDADRLAVVVRHDGQWTPLTGNEIGGLLADHLLEHHNISTARAGNHPVPLVISTIVSTPWLGAIARAHGARWEQTLTGFKWIANRALERQANHNERFVFGFEEAIGFTAGLQTRDKDGVLTAALVADLASHCKAERKTLLDRRNELFQRDGVHLSTQHVVEVTGANAQQELARMMEHLRNHPPTHIADQEILHTEDYQSPRNPSFTLPANILVWNLQSQQRVIIRPSGTEPKLKIYLDIASQPSDDIPSTLKDTQTRLSQLKEAAIKDLAP